MRRQLTTATNAAARSTRARTAATTIPIHRNSLPISRSPRARACATSGCWRRLLRGAGFPKAAPGLFVVTIDQEGAFGLGRRQDRQERHRLLRGVVNRVHDVLTNERALPCLEGPFLAIHPLLGDPVDHINDLLARRMVVKPMAGAGPHRHPDQRELSGVGEPRS